MAESQRASLHIVVFPWLAFGHMIPFLELSKRLARRGHAVTFVSTPRNSARLGAVPSELSTRVRVVTLDLPAVERLPDGAESTADVPPEKVELLKMAFDGLAAGFKSLVADSGGGDADDEFSRKPDWIILDFAHDWLMPIADDHKIACAMYLIFPVALLAYIGPKHENEAHPRTTTEDYMVQPPWIPFPSNLCYRRYEAEVIARGFRPNASGVSDIDRLMQLHHPSCRLVVHRSCPEAEPRLFPLLTDLFAKPVVPAGLLLPDDVVVNDDAPAPDGDGDGKSSLAPLMRWLDEQPRRSVIYVALGSSAPVTAGHVRELARGLELSGARFLWALRPPPPLPGGFEQRVVGRGVVRAGWVPQVRVLAHGAVAVFLTHCGWGSTVEGLCRFGRSLVMLPFVGDQSLIAQEVAARGAGVEVPRDDADGSFRAAGDDSGRGGRGALAQRRGAAEGCWGQGQAGTLTSCWTTCSATREMMVVRC